MVFVCLIGMSRNSSAEDLSVSITPAFGPYLFRTMPWTSEEKVVVQCDISGLEADEQKKTIFYLTVNLLQDGKALSSQSQQYPGKFGKLSTIFTFGPLPPGNFTIQITVNDRVSGKTVVKEMPIKIDDKKDFRLLHLTFLEGLTKQPCCPICFADQPMAIVCACSSAVQEGDDVSVTICDKESSEVFGAFDVNKPHHLFFISFQLSKPGKNVLLLKAENKTKNQKVEYEIPIFVVDPNELSK